MTERHKANTVDQPPPLKIERLFHAPRARVFEAWSSAEHVKRWFSPEIYTVPEATVDFRVGGAFDVCMRAPDGTDHWSRGTFVEVKPCDRLVFEGAAVDADGAPLFSIRTEVDFADALGGTRMTVLQTYAFVNPALAAPMVAGAPLGWSQTLDKLAAELVRMGTPAETERSVVHATFHLERTYNAPIARVYEALSNEAAKSKWFGGPAEQWAQLERSMDFRIGGRERAKGQWKGGTVSTFDAIYHDIVPQARIVYTYEMHIDDRKISVSLATMQLKADSDGRTTLMVTEQGAFLDGYDDAGSREIGTGFLLDALGASL